MKYRFKIAIVLATGLLCANAARATLISAGAGLVYDNVANVTWSSDANLFGTMAASDSNLANKIIAAVPIVHDTPNISDNGGPGNYILRPIDFHFSSSGSMDWFGAMAWVKYLDSINYLGHNTWMLPTTYDQNCRGYNCTNSMLSELFYTGLGGTATNSIVTTHNASYSLFTNVQNSVYWSNTENPLDPVAAWLLISSFGLQGAGPKVSDSGYSWAVLPGHATAGGPTTVPEPASLALMLLGLPLMGVSVRRRR